jgi:AcrR family transcriptional regulator
MSKDVKPRRAYRSAQRQLGAAETRDAVLAAAKAAFVRVGWTRTTITSVARDAAVAPETVYAAFGNKRALIKTLVGQTIRRDAPDVPLLDQAEPRAVREAPDSAAVLSLFAADIAAVLEQVAPLMAVVQEAALAEPELDQLYRELHAGRRRNLASVTAALASHGGLRKGLDEAEALDAVWRMASPEQFMLCRRVEGLSVATYVDWLATSLKRMLLE